jgi:cobalamin biosynthesis Mg chelatase CobN
MTADTPNGDLRGEIARTRSDLGDTIEALAAKTDVKARSKDAVNDVTDQAKAKARDVRDQAVGVAATVGDQVRSNAEVVKESLADGDVVGAIRTPLPIVGLAFAAALIGVVIYIVRRRGA